jgi:hypothetical protein
LACATDKPVIFCRKKAQKCNGKVTVHAPIGARESLADSLLFAPFCGHCFRAWSDFVNTRCAAPGAIFCLEINNY